MEFSPNFLSIFFFLPFSLLSLSNPVAYSFLLVMVLLLMAPLAIPLKMTFYPSNRSKSAHSSSPEDNHNTENVEPLLEPSSSAASLGSFYENDSISEIEMLLAEGEGAIKKKRRPRIFPPNRIFPQFPVDLLLPPILSPIFPANRIFPQFPIDLLLPPLLLPRLSLKSQLQAME